MAEHPLQPFCGVGRNRRPALEQFIHMLGAEIQPLGQIGLGPANFLKHHLDQFTGGEAQSALKVSVTGSAMGVLNL